MYRGGCDAEYFGGLGDVDQITVIVSGSGRSNAAMFFAFARSALVPRMSCISAHAA